MSNVATSAIDLSDLELFAGVAAQAQALARLAEEPGLVPAAVEEFLRWASPVYHFRRTARRDIELRGQQVRAGDKVVVWLPAGNRDEGIAAWLAGHDRAGRPAGVRQIQLHPRSRAAPRAG